MLAEGVLGKLTARQEESIQRIRRSIQSSLHLINELLSYNTFVEKVNHDVANLKAGYDQIADAYIRGSLQQAPFSVNVGRIAKQLALVDRAYGHIEEETKRLLSVVRVMTRRDVPEKRELHSSIRQGIEILFSQL